MFQGFVEVAREVSAELAAAADGVGVAFLCLFTSSKNNTI